MKHSSNPEFVVVTAVFEDKDACRILLEELAALHPNIFVTVVDDGSVWEQIEPDTIEASGLRGVLIRLNRNVGHQRAIAVGITYVTTQYPESNLVIMDCDGEDDPASIRQLVAKQACNDVDIVVAKRRKRFERPQFKIFYFIYRTIFRVLTGKSISFGNFMALKPRASKRLACMPELWVHVAAAALASRLRIHVEPIDRGRRYAGQSKMNFSTLALHGFRALTIFAEDVLVRVGLACAVIALLSLIAMPIPLAFKAIGMATPGWSSVIFGLLLLVFIQTGTIALIILLTIGLLKPNVKKHSYESYVQDVIQVAGSTHGVEVGGSFSGEVPTEIKL